jgi:UMF1 family MFS transporter
MQTSKNIFLWALYDFANSLVSIVFFLYFAQWIVIEKGLSDLAFNLTFTVATIFLICTAPFLGVMLDKKLRRIVGLRWTTLATSILYGACAWFAVSGSAIPALIFFTLGMFSYQLTFTCYTPLINDIATPERRGRISGYGIAANYLGQFVGLLFVLPFSKGTISWFGTSPRVETLFPAVIAFVLVSLPMLIWFKEDQKKAAAETDSESNMHIPVESGVESRDEETQFALSIKELIHKTKQLFTVPGVGLFILAYFFFNDAILTASNNFPIFMQQVWGVSDTTKTYILLGIILTSAIGGLVSGFVADTFGHKRTLFYILVGWVFILPFVGFIQNFTLFVIATTVMGIWFGSNWAVSRSVMSYLTPPDTHNLAFSYFNLIERASSLVGPIVWGLVVTGLVSMGSYRYRLATLAVTLFILLGLWCLTKVRSDR